MGAVKLEYLPYYTYADYQLFEGDWELIDGLAYAMAPAPVITHQIVSKNILKQLDSLFEECSKCLVVHEADWQVSDDTVVRPDVLMICKEVDEHIVKTPEIIFEVISPSTAKRDERQKFELYEQEGVLYYILVYPKMRVAKMYRLYKGRLIKEGDFENEQHPFEVKGCQKDFDFSKIWR